MSSPLKKRIVSTFLVRFRSDSRRWERKREEKWQSRHDGNSTLFLRDNISIVLYLSITTLVFLSQFMRAYTDTGGFMTTTCSECWMVAIERSNRFPSAIRIKNVDEIVIKGYSITIFLLRWFLNSSRSNFSTISRQKNVVNESIFDFKSYVCTEKTEI